MDTTRRHFLRSGLAASTAFPLLAQLADAQTTGDLADKDTFARFGPLKADPEGLIDLPDGWRYKVVDHVGAMMSDGFVSPGSPDGMATFRKAGNPSQLVLLRNHELEPDEEEFILSPFGADNALAGKLDKTMARDITVDGRPCPGGVTRLIIDLDTLELVHSELALVGTVNNCAGGPTPWGSWISCEETEMRKGEQGATQDHGYAFEVAANVDGLVAPRPLIGLGRFNHEAVAVDPATSIVYMTEDVEDGLIYRFVPDAPGDLHAGGRLQALAIKGQDSADTRNWEGQKPFCKTGDAFDVHWIDLADPEAPENNLRLRGFQSGAALFARGEGMWFGQGEVYFTCTSGGRNQCGQIWKLVPGGTSGTDRLILFSEPNDRTRLDYCDNLTVAPWGELVVCENGDGQQYLRILGANGAISTVARLAAGPEDEFAGICFSPDGEVMFVNIQETGATLAILPPWRKL
jgi:secreted PhoX family phosphatase